MASVLLQHRQVVIKDGSHRGAVGYDNLGAAAALLDECHKELRCWE